MSFAIVAGITAIQYVKYGTQRYLGWDTANYVYLTVQMDQYGLGTIFARWHYYPHLYVTILYAAGKMIGDVTLAARLIPFVWVLVALIGYQRLSWNLQRNVALANLTVVLAGISINTFRLFADLHRGLMAFSLSLLALILISQRTLPLLRLTRQNLVILGLLTAILATQIEQFAVVALALVVSTVFRRNPRLTLEMVVFCSIPLLVLSPAVIGLLIEYPSGLELLQPQELGIDPYNALLFGTGSLFTLPFVGLGIVFVAKLAREGNLLAQMIAGWLITLGAILVVFVSGIVPLPPLRVLYVVPVPLLLGLSLPAIDWLAEKYRKRSVAGESGPS